jgi:hypothetical protein
MFIFAVMPFINDQPVTVTNKKKKRRRWNIHLIRYKLQLSGFFLLVLNYDTLQFPCKTNGL